MGIHLVVPDLLCVLVCRKNNLWTALSSLKGGINHEGVVVVDSLVLCAVTGIHWFHPFSVGKLLGS